MLSPFVMTGITGSNVRQSQVEAKRFGSREEQEIKKLEGQIGKEIIDLPRGQINKPSLGKHYSPLFLSVTPSSPYLGILIWHCALSLRALNSPRVLHKEIQRIKDTARCTRRDGPTRPSRTAEANLDSAFVKNTLLTVFFSKNWKSALYDLPVREGGMIWDINVNSYNKCDIAFFSFMVESMRTCVYVVWHQKKTHQQELNRCWMVEKELLKAFGDPAFHV